MRDVANFASEAALCAAFISQLPAGWTAYAETGGFDILLVRDVDGAQIGIEAKLTLNAKVIEQAAGVAHWHQAEEPDFRAVLVPWGRSSGLAGVCSLIGITVIEMATKELYLSWRRPDQYGYARRDVKKFRPDLPVIREDTWYYWRKEWHDRCPVQRVTLPEYIPDVAAGASAPTQLSIWKISAIKLCILLDRRGYVTSADFKELKISPSRWTQHFLEKGPVKGQYVRGKYTPDYRSAHPVNFGQIEADFEKWKPKHE